ncbi:hypothetical protein [Actinoplanes sp. NPDC051411]|uniref:hypothetical protein n=1 Tax=Actinoplanes sp. NPDC051411 TaxID=3155522 RepID=UPI00341BB91B
MPSSDSRPTTATGSSGPRPWFWIVPALTFGVGLVGGSAFNTKGGGTDGATAPTGPPSATATASPTAPGDLTITVPRSCEQGLERARRALSTVDDTVKALRHLDAARLADGLGRLQTAQQDVNRLADQCRTEARATN